MEKNMICGCMVEGENIPCVFDDPAFTFEDCNYAKRLHANGKGRDDCEYWKPLADEDPAASHLTAEIAQLTAERDRYKAVVEYLNREAALCDAHGITLQFVQSVLSKTAEVLKTKEAL